MDEPVVRIDGLDVTITVRSAGFPSLDCVISQPVLTLRLLLYDFGIATRRTIRSGEVIALASSARTDMIGDD
ncbi:hypothetical protein EEB19_20255 [Gordonia sp. OPL2]|nr:hypothetical protein EEB19_20255 [Gordonia sp. OPL2]